MNFDLINLGGLESKRLNELETQLSLISTNTINLDHDSLVFQEDSLYFNFKKEINIFRILVLPEPLLAIKAILSPLFSPNVNPSNNILSP